MLNKKSAEQAKRSGQYIYIDFCGKEYIFASKELQQSAEFKILSANEDGTKFFIVMTDDFSRYCKTVFLKHKNETEQTIQEFISEIEAKEYRVEAIQKDGSDEFDSKKFEK